MPADKGPSVGICHNRTFCRALEAMIKYSPSELFTKTFIKDQFSTDTPTDTATHSGSHIAINCVL